MDVAPFVFAPAGSILQSGGEGHVTEMWVMHCRRQSRAAREPARSMRPWTGRIPWQMQMLLRALLQRHAEEALSGIRRRAAGKIALPHLDLSILVVMDGQRKAKVQGIRDIIALHHSLVHSRLMFILSHSILGVWNT